MVTLNILFGNIISLCHLIQHLKIYFDRQFDVQSFKKYYLHLKLNYYFVFFLFQMKDMLHPVSKTIFMTEILLKLQKR